MPIQDEPKVSSHFFGNRKYVENILVEIFLNGHRISSITQKECQLNA